MIELLSILFQTHDVMAGILDGRHVLDALGVAGPTGWAVHFYYLRREANMWRHEANKYQGKYEGAVNLLISHGHESPAEIKI